MMRLAVYRQDEGGNQVNELSWWLLQKNKCKRMRVLTLILLHLLVSQSHQVVALGHKWRRGIRVWRKGLVGPAEWVGW